ncbi:hypothetical protein [Streptomyces sp. NPDC050264]|uniref:hypothetical protein n=1 Tax=Streptomyces sp. NPDC050264 TaxID=3155038 RepID=UPI0034294448
MRTRISPAGLGLAAAAVLGTFAAPGAAAAAEPPPAADTTQTSEITDLICPAVQNILNILQAVPFVGDALKSDAVASCEGSDSPGTVNQEKGTLDGNLDGGTSLGTGGAKSAPSDD